MWFTSSVYICTGKWKSNSSTHIDVRAQFQVGIEKSIQVKYDLTILEFKRNATARPNGQAVVVCAFVVVRLPNSYCTKTSKQLYRFVCSLRQKSVHYYRIGIDFRRLVPWTMHIFSFFNHPRMGFDHFNIFTKFLRVGFGCVMFWIQPKTKMYVRLFIKRINIYSD